jgi:hypothetical protein
MMTLTTRVSTKGSYDGKTVQVFERLGRYESTEPGSSAEERAANLASKWSVLSACVLN